MKLIVLTGEKRTYNYFNQDSFFKLKMLPWPFFLSLKARLCFDFEPSAMPSQEEKSPSRQKIFVSIPSHIGMSVTRRYRLLPKGISSLTDDKYCT